MAQAPSDDRPLAFDDLTAWFARGGKPPADFRVGAEHEKFVFRVADDAPVPYEGEAGIHALLEGLKRFGWAGTYELNEAGGQTLIGLSRGMANVSLEPGGQFELSGAPLPTMHDICEETGAHLTEVKAVAEELGLEMRDVLEKIGNSKLGDANAAPALQAARSDPSSTVRAHAELALHALSAADA